MEIEERRDLACAAPAGIRVGPRGHERPYGPGGPAEDCGPERRLPTVVDPVGISATLEQHGNSPRMVVISREDQQSVSAAAREVHRDPAINEPRKLLVPPPASEIEDVGEERQLLLREVHHHG